MEHELNALGTIALTTDRASTWFMFREQLVGQGPELLWFLLYPGILLHLSLPAVSLSSTLTELFLFACPHLMVLPLLT